MSEQEGGTKKQEVRKVEEREVNERLKNKWCGEKEYTEEVKRVKE